ncbi:MAG: glycosyltransferase family 61 protein [Bacteroidota bacterium]|nr:glycosyltransferase family 61 protein [Bacteroidota bacterium]
MKYYLFRIILKNLRKLSLLIQIGNPFGKAPSLTDRPSNAYLIKTLVEDETKINIWQLPNVIVSGIDGGAIIDQDNKVYNRFINFAYGNDVHLALSSPYLGRRMGEVQKAIFLITPEAKGNYYHWIADLLPRLLLIWQQDFSDLNKRLIVIHTGDRRYENDTFKLLKISNEKILRLAAWETFQVSDLIVSDLSLSYVGRPFPKWKKKLLDEFKKKVVSLDIRVRVKNIYMVRGKQSKRCLIGEEELILRLKEINFEIIDPIKLSLVEQITVLSQAKVVVALHGAALTNIVFCQEETIVVELRSIFNPPEFYSEIAKTYSLRFETLSLPAQNDHKEIHIANKQNLVWSNDFFNQLISKF